VKSFNEFLFEEELRFKVRPAHRAMSGIDSPFGFKDGIPITTPNQDGAGEEDDEDGGGPIEDECPWGPCEEMVPPCDYFGGNWCEEWEWPWDPEWCNNCCNGGGCWGHIWCIEDRCVFIAIDGTRYNYQHMDGTPCGEGDEPGVPYGCYWQEIDPWYEDGIIIEECPWGPCDTMPPCNLGNWCEYWDYDEPPEWCTDCCDGMGCWGQYICDNNGVNCQWYDIGGQIYGGYFDENGMPCETPGPDCTWHDGGLWYEPGLESDMDWAWWSLWGYAWFRNWLRVHKWPGPLSKLPSTLIKQIIRFFIQPHAPTSLSILLRTWLLNNGFGLFQLLRLSRFLNAWLLRIPVPMGSYAMWVWLGELAEFLGIEIGDLWDFVECLVTNCSDTTDGGDDDDSSPFPVGPWPGGGPGPLQP